MIRMRSKRIFANVFLAFMVLGSLGPEIECLTITHFILLLSADLSSDKAREVGAFIRDIFVTGQNELQASGHAHDQDDQEKDHAKAGAPSVVNRYDHLHYWSDVNIFIVEGVLGHNAAHEVELKHTFFILPK